MAKLNPFRAVRPPEEHVAAVSAPPYDVVSTEEARVLARGNPLSFLHVSRPEIDLAPGVDLYSDQVYEKAAENYEKLKRECPLEAEGTPSIYLYKLVMGGHEQIGVVACASVDEYDNDLIKKHEKTRRDKEDDRTRHMIALRAQTGPVFLTYRSDQKIDSIVGSAVSEEPIYDFTAPDGIRHTVWRMTDPSHLLAAFEAVPFLYIADGHHRAASANRARAVLRDQSAEHTGNEEYNFFLSVIFPDNQMQILPYNRVVKDLNGRSPDQFLEEVRDRFDVSDGTGATPEEQGDWRMYLGGKWYRLSRKFDQTLPGDPVDALDVSELQDNLLDPILGIKDVRTDKRIDFVGGIRGTAELEKLVDEGRAAVAFSLFATSIRDLLEVADAGGIMPPKSTWFEPKLRDGILIHAI